MREQPKQLRAWVVGDSRNVYGLVFANAKNRGIPATVGIDFVKILDNDPILFEPLVILDRHDYSSVLRRATRNTTDIFFLVYDAANNDPIKARESFTNIRTLIPEIKAASPSPNLSIVLIGNHRNSHGQVIMSEEGAALAEEHDIRFFETSTEKGEYGTEPSESAYQAFQAGVEMHRAKMQAIEAAAQAVDQAPQPAAEAADQPPQPAPEESFFSRFLRSAGSREPAEAKDAEDLLPPAYKKPPIFKFFQPKQPPLNLDPAPPYPGIPLNLDPPPYPGIPSPPDNRDAAPKL